MVIDSSAIMAILLGEPDAENLAAAISKDATKLMSAMSVLESAVVMAAKKGEAGGREFDLLLHKAGIEVVSLTGDHVGIARSAYARFGKGRHRAGLNLGDCCAYALSMFSGEPLLFKGNDFSLTDVLSIQT